MHLPVLWKFRLLSRLKAKGNSENRRLFQAWEISEGSRAEFNPLDTTEPWPGSTNYNSAGVKNYPSGSAGLDATVATLTNGRYDGIVADLRAGIFHAEQIVSRNHDEFVVWGTDPSTILDVLVRV